MTENLWRDDFDLPAGVTYLNTAYMGPLPQVVVEAGMAGLRSKARPWELSTDDFFRPVERVRDLFAALIGGDADGVALIPAVSYGIASAAANLPITAGDRIVVLHEQFPSNLYSWRALAAQSGAEMVTVTDRGDGLAAAVVEAIDHRTRIVAVPTCHWTNGAAVDLEAVGRRVRQVGAALVVDGTQSIGAVPFDVARIEPDFVVCAAYKWLLGPYSVAFLWAAPRWRSGDPLEESWYNRAGSEDFSALVDYTDDYRPGARRFDVGEVANFALVPAVIAALEYIGGIGVEIINRHSRLLSDHLVEGATELGLAVPAPENRSAHLTGLDIGDRHPSLLAAALADQRIFVSVRGSAVRVSTHLYNTPADVARLLEVLGRTLG